MKRPSIQDLPPDLAAAARGLAERLDTIGARAWLVGGAVRDLALDMPVGDLDLASAARPEEVEPLFPRVVRVGRAFGTLVVPWEGQQIQLTTFREEGGYGDGRRPDEVRYGETPEVDARRRDFTCNALYLDPRDDELLDPCGGLEDLAAGRLRCVGDPGLRFAEDGLRLLRLARFAAALDLEVEPELLEAAGAALDSLRGVSAERVLDELGRMANRPRCQRAFAILVQTGVASRAFPALAALRAEGVTEAVDLEGRLSTVGRLEARRPGGPGTPLVLAAWFDPGVAERTEAASAALAGLRAPRALAGAVTELWQGRARVRALGDDPDGIAERAERQRLVRLPEWESLRDFVAATGGDEPILAELERLAEMLSPEARRARSWIASGDLAAAGVPRGPSWGRILREAEDLRLAGEHTSREEALAWLAERSRGRA